MSSLLKFIAPTEEQAAIVAAARDTDRPSEPEGNNSVWYRGWEIGWEEMREHYTGSGWTAYKGGADLDARCVDAVSYSRVLDEIDEEEDNP